MVDFSALIKKKELDQTRVVEVKPKKRHLFVSHSSISLLHSCARKFEFRKLFNHPRKESNVKAELGKALHRGYQHYLMHGDEEKAIFEYMLAYPIHLMDNPMDGSSIESGYSTLMGIMNATPLLEYEVAKIRCNDGTVRPAIEVPFEIVLEGYSLVTGEDYSVSYTGYIDAILYNIREQSYVVVDIKTTQWKLNDFTPVYQFSEQCVPYGLVLEYMKEAEINNFEIKYLSCQIDILNPNIQLYPFDKNKKDIQNWFRGLMLDLNTIKLYMQMSWWPRTGGGRSCVAFNRKCEFFDICMEEDPDIIRKIIEEESSDMSKYELDEALKSKTLREDWNPWVKFSLEVPT